MSVRGVELETGGSAPALTRSRGPVLPRLDAGKLARHLPAVRRVRIEVNGILAGVPTVIPDALTEFAIGWAFLHRFFNHGFELGKVSTTSSRVSLMVDSGVDLDRRAYETIGWIAPADAIVDEGTGRSGRPPRAVPVMSGLDAVATCKAAFDRFEEDGARAGYLHAGLATADDVLCIARDLSPEAAACKVLGWALSSGADCASSMLAVRGVVGHLVVDAASRAGIPVVATDAVPTADAIATAEATCTTIIGLALSHRRGLFADGGHFAEGRDHPPVPETTALQP